MMIGPHPFAIGRLRHAVSALCVVLASCLLLELTNLPATAAETDAAHVVQLVDTIKRSETPPQGPTGTWNGFKQIDPNTRIDFILTRPARPRVPAHRTDDPKTPAGRFASDHLRVAVTVQLQ